jgi:hypothetical protein
MRSNSGKGKSNNNLLDPTMKEHEQQRHEGPAQAHQGDLEPAGSDEAGEPRQSAAGPIPKH